MEENNETRNSDSLSAKVPATYRRVLLTHVLEVEPLDLYADIVKLAGNVIKGDFVNGTFFGPYQGKVVSIGNIISKGKLLAKQLPHDAVKRGNFIVQRDGSVSVEMIQDIEKEKDISKIWFAISGFNLFPLNLKAEWFDQRAVGYTTWRTCLGYNPEKKKAIITIRPLSDANRGLLTLKNLGCDRGIGLDSGTSTCGRFCGRMVRLTDRVIHNVVRW